MGQNFDQAKCDNTSWPGPNILTGSVTFHLSKDLWMYGQNSQIFKYIVGGLKNPYSFTDTQYFLDFYSWNYFSIHVKHEGMTQYDIFHDFVENSVNSVLCLFWAQLKIHPKMPMFERHKKQVPVNSKKVFAPH